MPSVFRQPGTRIGRVADTVGILAEKNGYRVADLSTVAGAKCANCCCLWSGLKVVIEGVSMCGCVDLSLPQRGGVVTNSVQSVQLSGDVNGSYLLKGDPASGTNQYGGAGCDSTLDIGCKPTWKFYGATGCGGTARPQGLQTVTTSGGPVVAAYYTYSHTALTFIMTLTPNSMGEFDPSSYALILQQQLIFGADVCGNPSASVLPVNYFLSSFLPSSAPDDFLCGRLNRCRKPLVLANSLSTCGLDGGGLFTGGHGGTATITPVF